MKYTNKYGIHNWEDGETITNALLNHIEESLQDLDDAVGLTEFDGDSISDAINNSQKVTENLLNYNCYDVLQYADRRNGTSYGITWTWNEDGSVTATGEATGTAVRNLGGSLSEIPSWIVPGNTYYLKYSGTNVYVYISYSVDGEHVSGTVTAYSDKVITVPTGIVGARIRLRAVEGVVVNETVNPVLLSSIPNDELGAKTEAITSTQAENTAQIARVNNILNHEPMHNYLGGVINSPDTAYGLTCSQSDDGTYAITGTATSSRTTLFYDIYYNKTALPDGMEAGKTYHLFADSTQFGARIISYTSESDSGTVLIDGMMDGFVSTDFTIPADATGISFRWQARNIVKGVSYNYTNMRVMVTPPDAFIENLIKSYDENISKNAHIWCIGNSFLNGAVYNDGHLDHMAPYDDAIYGQIAYALNISPENNTHVMYSSTGLITPPSGGANGSFLDIITQTSLAPYDFLVTHFNSGDINGHALGTINSTANDGTIAGGVIALMNYIRTNNGLCKLILLSVPPYSSDPAKSGEYVFTGNWGMGYSINDLDTLMYQLAKKLHFIYISWQDLEISYHYMNYADYDPSQTNVRHAASNAAYRALGQYVVLQLSAAISEANVAVEAQAISDTIELVTEYVRDMSPTTTVGPISVAAVADAAPLNADNVTIAIDPVQDLHGYDNPWPGGSGKNLCPFPEVGWSYNPTSGEKITDAITAAGTDKFAVDFSLNPNYTMYTNIAVNCMVLAWDTNENFVGRTSGALRNNKSVVISKSSFSSGTGGNRNYDFIASIGVRFYESSDGTQSIQDVNNGFIQIEVGDTYTGYESYSNICPVSGWNGVTVKDEGKNLLDNTLCIERTNNGVTRIINDDGTITLNGTSTSTSLWWKSADNMNVTIKAGTYTLSIDSVVSGLSIRLTLKNSGEKIGTFTLDEDDVITNLRFYAATGTGFNNSVTRCQLERGSTVTSFEPFKSCTASVDFDTTIYGGTVDLTKGILTVNRAIVDLGTLTWTKPSSDQYMYTTGIANIVSRPSSNSVVAKIICSHLATSSASAIDVSDVTGGLIGIASDGNIWCRFNKFSTDTETFKASVSGFMLCYPLATPITFDLTPQEIMMMRGYNTLYADTGNITLNYHVDLSKYINTMAGKAHMLCIGDLFFNGAVYNNGQLDHMAAYENTIYGQIASSLKILKEHNTHMMYPSTGLLSAPSSGANGSFLDIITQTSLTPYDYIVTLISGDDINNNNLGSIRSSANDGSIAGGVMALMDYIKTNNGLCRLILLSVPPYSSNSNTSGDKVFTSRWDDSTDSGYGINDLDNLMYDLAMRLHFTYISWQDLEISYHFMDYATRDSNQTDILYATDDIVYRIMGQYVGLQIAAMSNPIALAKTTRVYTLNYYTYDGSSLLYSEIVFYGGSGNYKGPTPTRGESYTWIGWGLNKKEGNIEPDWDPDALKNITSNRNVYAAYLSHYA